jgi:hypothetical protein
VKHIVLHNFSHNRFLMLLKQTNDLGNYLKFALKATYFGSCIKILKIIKAERCRHHKLYARSFKIKNLSKCYSSYFSLNPSSKNQHKNK